MALLDDADLAYMRSTQQDAQPTVATLLPESVIGRSPLGGVLVSRPGLTLEPSSRDTIETIGPWNDSDPSPFYGRAYIEFRHNLIAAASATIAWEPGDWTLDGQPDPNYDLTLYVWVDGDEAPLDGSSDGGSLVGYLGAPGQTLDVVAGVTYVAALTVYGAHIGSTAAFGAVIEQIEGTGTPVTIRIDNDPRAPEALRTEHGIHLVRITAPQGVAIKEGDTLLVSSAEEYRVVSHGDMDPWTTAQRLWAVRVVRGGA